ncbi:MBL fold metallo-hydrolase [Glaciibacter sp. 2TAF33]|uniref:MBL fold metallo-hydrolase n=1 Tax=Glaciibacter sp. 2TAF33 TaxID=3233015 RepID=UPI003F9280B6
MANWTELADGVFHRRYEPLDVSVCLVSGADGLLLVDTRGNPREAEQIITDAAEVTNLSIRWVVNTHAHYDHTFGNQRFRTQAEIYGHARIPAHFSAYEQPRLDAWTADPAVEPQHDWDGVLPTPPTHLVSAPTRLDLGGREVRLLPLQPGHTDTDLVVEVPDADVWIVGDVVEESGPPMYGSGSFPLEWPGVLDRLANLLGAGSIVVPGHGRPVDRDFVGRQAETLHRVAEAITTSFERSEPLGTVVTRLVAETGLPEWNIEAAVRRGHALLNGRGQG